MVDATYFTTGHIIYRYIQGWGGGIKENEKRGELVKQELGKDIRGLDQTE